MSELKLEKEHSTYTRTGKVVDGEVQQSTTGLFDIILLGSELVKDKEKEKIFNVRLLFFRTKFGDKVLEEKSITEAGKKAGVSTSFKNKKAAVKELKEGFPLKEGKGVSKTSLDDCDLYRSKVVKKEFELVFSKTESQDVEALSVFSGVIGSQSVSFTLVETLRGADETSFSVDFDEVNGFLAVGRVDTVFIRDVNNSFNVVQTLSDGSGNKFTLEFDETNGFLAVGDTTSDIFVYDVNNSFNLVTTLSDSRTSDNLTFANNSVSFDETNGFLAVANSDDDTYVYDVNNNFNLVTTLTDSGGDALAASFDETNGFLAVGSADNNTYVYDVNNSFNLVTTLTDSSVKVKSVSFDAINGFLAVATGQGNNDGNNIYVYDANNSFNLNTTLGDQDGVNSVNFDEVNGFLAVGKDNNDTKVYNVNKSFNQEEVLTDSSFEVFDTSFDETKGFLANVTAATFGKSGYEDGGDCFVYSYPAGPNLGSIFQTDSSGVKQTDSSGVVLTQP